MDTLLPPHPLQLATVGFLGNEYGIATLGYVVLPPVVSRFPAEGIVQEGSFLTAWIDEPRDWWADTVSYEWWGVVDSSLFDLEGMFGSVLYRAVVEARAELVASILDRDGFFATVEDSDDSADVEIDGMVGVVGEDGDTATVQEIVSLAMVTDKSGDGCC